MSAVVIAGRPDAPLYVMIDLPAPAVQCTTGWTAFLVHASYAFPAQCCSAVYCAELLHHCCCVMQVLITGKISQAVVVAAAAYRTEAEFSERTGIQQNKLIIDELHTNTHVSLPFAHAWCLNGTSVTCCCLRTCKSVAYGMHASWASVCFTRKLNVPHLQFQLKGMMFFCSRITRHINDQKVVSVVLHLSLEQQPRHLKTLL